LHSLRTYSYKLPGDKPAAVKDYNVGLTYGQRGWITALTTSDKMSTFNLSAAYAPSSNVTGVAVAAVTPEKNTQLVTVGLKYACNPNTTMRAKVSLALQAMAWLIYCLDCVFALAAALQDIPPH
jgi:hypothetical protein